jgi:glycosyltransferase involved in cell wall biosynthesis
MTSIGFDISGLDPNFKEHATRGIGRYVSELYQHFKNLDDPKVKIGWFDHRQLTKNNLVDRLIDHLPLGKMTARQQLLYPFRLGHGPTKNFDLLHFPAHMDVPSWCPKPFVLTVMDLIPLVLSDLYRANNPGWRFALARWLEIRAIKNASLILAISDNTAHDINRVLGIPMDRIRVTYLGINDKFFDAKLVEDEVLLRQRYRIPPDRKIVLYVGGIDQRKNYRGLLSSFGALLEIFKDQSQSAPILVIAGGIESNKEYPRLMDCMRQLGLKDHVVMPGYVTDGDLLQLFAISSVFHFPSLYEGFGFPPLEAMAAGLPVVSSNTSCMPEILGDAALLVDPTDSRESAKALFDVMTNEEVAGRLRQAGKKRARLFTWDLTAQKTLQAYQEFSTPN